MFTAQQTFRPTLTRREKEILNYVADGMSTKQIAGKLFISEYTVTAHRKNILLKTGAKNSAELIQRSIINYSK